MLHDMPGSCVSALRGPPCRHGAPRQGTMPCQVCASASAGAWRCKSLDISPPRRCVSPRSALARLSWTRASCVGARPDCQSLALALARMSLRRWGRTRRGDLMGGHLQIEPERGDRIKPPIKLLHAVIGQGPGSYRPFPTSWLPIRARTHHPKTTAL